MKPILRMIIASVLSLVGAGVFTGLGYWILLDTPFASAPLFVRLPGISERFCPESATLVMDRKTDNEIGRGEAVSASNTMSSASTPAER